MYGGQSVSYVDPTGMHMKLRAVKLVMAETIPPLVLKEAQEVFREARKNLSGPKSNTGKMPVPRVTGTLDRALTLTPVSPSVAAIWMNRVIAYYAPYVHDGTRYMDGRPYLAMAIRTRRPIAQANFQRALLQAVRGVGRR